MRTNDAQSAGKLGVGIGPVASVAANRRAGTLREPRGGTLIVGRSTEIELLSSAIERAVAGEGSCVVLSGEPGIGKSRLLGSLHHLAVARAVQTTFTTCQDHDRSSPFAPWAELLRQAVNGSSPTEIVEFVGEDFWSAVKLVPELEDRVWLHSASRADRSSWDAGDLLDSIVRILLRYAKKGPVLIVLDDLGWADASSLDLFLALARRAAEGPVILAGAFRDAHRAENPHLNLLAQAMEQDRRVRRIELGPLNSTDISAVVGAWLGSSTFDESLGTLVAIRSAGNPLFAEELVQSLLESGDVSPSGALLRTDLSSRSTIPTTIRAMIEQRLGQVPTEDLQVLRAAAVLGVTFPYGLLVETCGYSEDQVLRGLEYATRARLTRESIDQTSRPVYSFAHPLIQETLESQQLEPRARRIHDKAALALIRDKEANGVPDALIEYHLLRTGDPGRALEYAVRAGDRAASLFATDESAGHYRVALRLLEGKPVTELAARIEEALADQLLLLGDKRGAQRLCRLASQHRSELGQSPAAARALLKAARGATRAEADGLLRSAREMMGPSPQPSMLFDWLMVQGRFDDLLCGSVEHAPAFREALAIAESVGDPGMIAEACCGLADSLSLDQVTEFESLLDRTFELARTHHLPRVAFWASQIQACRAFLHQGMKPEEYERVAIPFLELGKAAGTLHEAGFVYLSGGAWSNLIAGRLAESLDYTRRWADRLRLVAVLDDPFVLIYQGGALLFQGKDEAAEETLLKVREQGRIYDRWIFEAAAEVWLAQLATRRGETQTAVERLRAARDIVMRAGPTLVQGRQGPFTVERLVRALLALGGIEEARGALRQLEVWAEAGPSRLARGYMHSGAGQICSADHKWTEALAHFESSLAIWHELDFRFEQGHAYEDLSAVHESLGESARAKEGLRAALNAYERMGAATEIERIARLIQ